MACAVLLLAGCWRSQEERESVTVERERHQVRGTVAGQPVDVAVQSTRETETTEQADTRSGVDAEAIGQAVAAAVGSALDSGSGGLLSGLGSLLATPEGGGGAMALLLGAGGLAYRERRRRVVAESSQTQAHERGTK